MNIVPLPQPNLMDVPASLRMLADKIDKGEVTAPVHAIVVCEDANGQVACFGYGAIGDTKSEVGLLTMAAMGMAIE